MKGERQKAGANVCDRSERPQRVVIDEAVGGKFRVLLSRMKATATEEQTLDPVAWEDEEERAMDEKQLRELLPDQDVKKVREGHVFKVKAGKSESISKEAREHIKEKTRKLLEREGKGPRDERGGL